MNITLAIPTYNSSQYVEEAIQYAINNDFVSEILIRDDCSAPGHYEKLESIASNIPKVRLILNKTNLGGFVNKYRAVESSSNDWVYLLDSDNHPTENTLSVIQSLEETLCESVIYCPEKLILHHDNQPPLKEVVCDFGEDLIDAQKVKHLLENNVEWTDWFLNTGNYLLHRENYCTFVGKHFLTNENPYAADVIAAAYYWLKSGGSFHIVKGWEYYHRLRNDSYWMSCGDNSSRLTTIYTTKILTL